MRFSTGVRSRDASKSASAPCRSIASKASSTPVGAPHFRPILCPFIRDPIRCFEYYGTFYVQEGNKRLSVLRAFDAPTVTASVLRIVPAYSDDPETRQYYEFLEFYHLSHMYAIRFSKPGQYKKLIAELGFEPDTVWSDKDRMRVQSAFTLFCESIKRWTLPEGMSASDAFLAWLSAYTLDDLKSMTEEQLLASDASSCSVYT